MSNSNAQALNALNDLQQAQIDRQQAQEAQDDCAGYLQQQLSQTIFFEFLFPGIGILAFLGVLYTSITKRQFKKYIVAFLFIIAFTLGSFFYFESQRILLTETINGTPAQQNQYCQYAQIENTEAAQYDTTNAEINIVGSLF